MLNPETMSKDQTRKEFAKFVEDFNTGTSTYPTSLRTSDELSLSSDAST